MRHFPLSFVMALPLWCIEEYVEWSMGVGTVTVCREHSGEMTSLVSL